MKKNFLLVLFGIFLSLIVLEILLSAMGMVYLFLEQRGNHVFLDRKNEIRVMCLGESTTAGSEYSYPRQMEVMLNSSQGSKKFSVINEGIPGITTDYIVGSLKQNLIKYKPDIVIVMMGINDGAFFNQNNTPLLKFLNHSHVFKLFRILSEHIRHKLTDKTIAPKDSNSEPSEDVLIAAVSKHPEDYNTWMNLGLYYKSQAQYSKAIKMFNNAMRLTPNDHAFIKFVLLWCLGESYKSTGLYNKSIDCFSRILTAMPQHPSVWADLADVYVQMQDYAMAQKLLERQIMIEPHEVKFYNSLLSCYELQKKYDQVELMLRYAIKMNPGALELYQRLGSFLMDHKQYLQAEQAFQEVLKLDPDDFHHLNRHIYTNLLVIYDQLAEPDKVREIKNKFSNEQNGYSFHTWENYRALIEILKEKGIRLIVMQYALRDPQFLKDNLGNKDIIYVDNRQPFESIISEKGYDYLFTDRFAGDFGHCTIEGNRLIAQNAAKAVLLQSKMNPSLVTSLE